MRHRDITVPDPEYKRFASAIRTVRQRADSRSTHPVARVRAGCCHRTKRAGGLLRVATPGHGRRHVPDVSVARPSFEEFPAMSVFQSRNEPERRVRNRGLGSDIGVVVGGGMMGWRLRRGQAEPSALYGFQSMICDRSCGIVGERRESVGRRWATRQRCPRAVHTARRARAGPRRGLVHNSTGRWAWGPTTRRIPTRARGHGTARRERR